MGDLLAQDNLCGGTLLRIVSRGSSIIAEMLRLKDNVPECFREEGGGEGEGKGFAGLMFDFTYWKSPEDYETKVNESDALSSVEDAFQQTFTQTLDRFYTLFSSIVKYHEDLTKFLQDLDEGYFIQYTLDNLLQDTTGKQLLCESLYLYGSMLLLMERHLHGRVREKIIVAHYRYTPSASGALDDIDKVCKLCRSTNYIPGQGEKPRKYEEKLFKRLPLPKYTVKAVIGRLLSDDVYLRAKAFPDPEHRSTRLQNQASQLYVILYFAPDMLKSDDRGMREVVDRYFNDNWIISMYMGTVVDLSVEWANYESAVKALNNTLTAKNVRIFHVENAKLLSSCMSDLKNYLTDGLLTDQFVLDNTDDILNCVRRCNVAIRWRIMHRKTNDKKLKEIICDTSNKSNNPVVLDTHVVTVLLNASQLEMKVKEIFRRLLEAKTEKWDTCKEQARGRMQELSEYFTGEKALTRVERDEGLMTWFSGMANEINSLSIEDSQATVTGRKIQHCVQALEDVEQFDVIDTNLSIKAFLKDTRDLLYQMVRAVNIKTSVLNVIEICADFSYAWEVMLDYVPVLHDRVKADPSTVVLLRALFLKLASILDIPIIRIMQCESPDALSVAEYYSNELVAFLRKVMEIIPISVFKILTNIVVIKERHLKPLPVRLEVDLTKDYAQGNERYELAKLTHQVSIFTEGILAMEKTLLGVIQVDPRAILEDGLRSELVRQMATAMDSVLRWPTDVTNPAASQAAVVKSLTALGNRVNGYRLAIEYIQDYCDLAGLKMWQAELARITSYNTEQESNRYLQKKIYDGQSRFQSRAIPIPRFSPIDSANNFMGRTVTALLRMTDASTTIYSPECGGWYLASGQEVCGISTISMLRKSIGIPGLTGLYKLLSFRIVNELQTFQKFFTTTVRPYAILLEQVRDTLYPTFQNPLEPARLYTAATKKTEKLMLPILTCLRRVGQCQLLLKMISAEIHFRSKLDANLMHSALANLSDSLVNDVRAHYRDPSKPIPKESNPLLPSVTTLLTASGLEDPLSKVYMTTDPLEGLPVLFLLFTCSYVSKFQYDLNFGTLVRSKASYPLDGWPVVVGMSTLLKQFHPSYSSEVLAYIGQFVRSTVQGMLGLDGVKVASLPKEVVNAVVFANLLSEVGKIGKAKLFEYVPQYLVETVCKVGQ
ncbi:hypothetical protein TrST_g9055 [Triparma strigata]|uniref:Strumpellin n=1 Tax=Triparma strigata TaxID=1606541 RepID=A0A9W6ZT05_9STRA|nr:hypothetical protein TrST_g9055 [Triparma strigata]